MRTIRAAGIWAGLFASVVAGACERQQADNPVSPTLLHAPASVRSYVTPEVAATLDASGQFRTDQVRYATRGIITPLQAQSLALAFAQEFGRYFQGQLDREHGSPINLDALTPTGRVVLAETPYKAPEAVVPGQFHEAIGPFYLVTLANKGVAAVSVAVSAYATDVHIDKGQLLFPQFYGEEFRFIGIASNGAYGNPIAPEIAAQIAASVSGARVAGTPQFVMRGARWFPQAGTWMVPLDRPITARLKAGGQLTRVTSVYIDRNGSVKVPVVQPDTGEVISYGFAKQAYPVRVWTRDGIARELVPAQILHAGESQ